MSRKPIRFDVNPLFTGPSLGDRAKAGSPYRELNISDIDVDPDQPRRQFDTEALAELAASIKQYGLICPILVKPTDGGTYRLVAGERRLRASKLLGRETIPAMIDSSEEESATLPKQLVENLQRRDLNSLERALAFGRLRDGRKLSVRDIAAELGVSKSYAQRTLELLDLPADLQAALGAGASESKVLLLAGIESEAERRELLEKLDQLTRADLEALINKGQGKKVSHRGTPRSGTAPRADDKRIAEDMQRSLGLKVQVVRRKDNPTHGKIEIEFYGDEDLNEVYRRLS